MVTIIKFGADESQEPETLSTWVGRVQILGLPSVLFPGIYTRNCIKSGAMGFESTLMWNDDTAGGGLTRCNTVLIPKISVRWRQSKIGEEREEKAFTCTIHSL